MGIFLSFMIGPVFFKLIQISILKGARAALAFDLGVVLCDVIFILAAYFGSKKLLIQIKDEPMLFYIGGSILIIYGIAIIFKNLQKIASTEHPQVKTKTNYLKLIVKGFLLNFINVGVLAFWLGMIVIAGSNLRMEPTKILHYFSLVLASYVMVDIVKIILAKQLKKKLTPKIIVRINRAMGMILILFGILLVLKGFIPGEKLRQIKGITSFEVLGFGGESTFEKMPRTFYGSNYILWYH